MSYFRFAGRLTSCVLQQGWLNGGRNFQCHRDNKGPKQQCHYYITSAVFEKNLSQSFTPTKGALLNESQLQATAIYNTVFEGTKPLTDATWI